MWGRMMVSRQRMPRGAHSLAMALILVATLWTVAPSLSVHAQAAAGLPAGASCSQLAAIDQTATNNPQWGRTLVPGHGASGGWFGVDVCGNGINGVTPGGANVSCDRVPGHPATTGCAPGRATYDGFGLTFQCVELIARFAAWAFGDRPTDWIGNAPDLWVAGNHPADFVAHANGGSVAPVPGDMLVWGAMDGRGVPWPAGPAGTHDGHIAVVASVAGSRIIIVEQNVLWGETNQGSEALSLVHTGSQWIVADNPAAAATLPTYHWRAAMGVTRALYGWLHSSKNNGRFTGAAAVPGTPVPAPTLPLPTTLPAAAQTPHPDTSGGLPSLARGVVVTAAGTLADLTWSDPDATSDAGPRATARSLGAPPGVHLAANQAPAIVTLPSGAREVFVLGQDGRLYVAHTAPALLGVTWQGLGAPGGVTLLGSAAASAFATGVATGALGSDGNLWWRAGPIDNLGGWTSLGRPSAAAIQSSPVLAAQPGTGAPLALALGHDGQLYETVWQDGASNDPDQRSGWLPWVRVSLPITGDALTGPLTLITELPGPRDWIGTWADVPLDVIVRNTRGELWWLRQAGGLPWSASRMSTSEPVTAVLGAVAVPVPSSSAAMVMLHVYVADAQGSALGVLQRPAQSGADAVTWARVSQTTTVSTAPSAANTPGSAMALGPDLSVLLRVAGQRLLLSGLPAALTVLAAAPTAASPLQSAPSGTPSTAPDGAQVAMGTVPTADTFGDGFTSTRLDPRWLVQGAPTSGAVSGGGVVALMPAAAPVRTLLVQGAPAGDLTLTARVWLPADPRTAPRAGLILYLDDANWLTLGVTPTGGVSLCALAWGEAAPCQQAPLPPGADLAHGVLLRLARQQSTFTGSVSADSSAWHVVGTWQPPASAQTGMEATPAASPASPDVSALPALAPLAFTSAGLFTQAAGASVGDPRTWPRFGDFGLAASAAGTRGTP